MCIGRAEPSNFFHPYLRALPESPGPASWLEELREELLHTSVHDFIEDSRQTLQCIIDGFVGRLPKRFPDLVPAGSLASVDCLHWARGMFLG